MCDDYNDGDDDDNNTLHANPGMTMTVMVTMMMNFRVPETSKLELLELQIRALSVLKFQNSNLAFGKCCKCGMILVQDR